MTNSDIYEYHMDQQYPSHNRAVIALLAFFGGFIAVGVYSIMRLWETYGTVILDVIQVIGLPSILTSNMLSIAIIIFSMIAFSLMLALGAAALAKKLGGTLIYTGAFFMNIMSWLVVFLLWYGSGFNFAVVIDSWPIMIPGLFTLFITLLLFTIFRDRIKRAGEIIKLTGQTCLDEKGLFIPPLLTMIFTLVSAVLFGAIILQFTPLDVILGTTEMTLETGLPLGIGLVVYLFTTIFFYNFAYATSSGMVYIYMRGRDPTLGDGVKSALGVIGGIIVLSIAGVIVKIVQIIIRMLGRKAGGAGRFVGGAASGIIGWVWTMINYFTIPAMVAEELGAKKGIKRSASLVKNNFVDVIIKETAVRWGFGVLAAIFFIAFAVGGAAIGWFLTADIFMTLLVTIIFVIFAAIPSTLVLRTFDIVYVTLLYVFIRRKEGDISGKTTIPAAMTRELDRSYSSARDKGFD